MRILSSLEFASPLYFWVGGAAILLLIFLPIWKRRSLRLDLGYWKKKVRLVSKKTWIVPILVIITSLLVAVALANPQAVEKRSIPLYGKPVMVVMDVSGSMGMVTGEEVSSFERSREVFYEIVNQDLGAAIGLLIYSSDIYIARDFTTKIELLRDTIENDAEIKEISTGTMTPEALWKAGKFFSEKITAKDKTIILISDLEDDLNQVGQVMQILLEDDIKVYAIVVTKEPQQAYQRIQELQTKMGSAEVKMVWVEDKEGIGQICEEIQQMESSFTGEVEVLSQKSLVPKLLPVILSLIILSIVLSETVFRKVP